MRSAKHGLNWENFSRWFNRDFWRAFKNRTFPIQIPKTTADQQARVRAVFKSVKSARYAPSIPEAEIVMNKGHGVARTVPVFCIEDYIVYYFCIKELEGGISGNRTEHTFGGWTLGGKLRKLEDSDIEFDTGFSSARYAFDPRASIAAFGEFNSLLFCPTRDWRIHARTSVRSLELLRLRSARHLRAWIREDAPSEKGWVVALLFYFLNQWNRRNTGLHPQGVGIPQDALADCSRLLANYYLQRYDKCAAIVCGRAFTSYFRYADDQMILVNGTDTLDVLMLLLARNLDRHGLRVNQKKVEIWTVKDLKKHRCREIQAIFANRGDNKNPNLVRKFVDAYLRLSDKQLKTTWNGGRPLLNRLLWANIESLPSKLFDVLLSRFTASAYLLRAEKDKLVRVHQLAKKRESPIKFRKRQRVLGQETVHNVSS